MKMLIFGKFLQSAPQILIVKMRVEIGKKDGDITACLSAWGVSQLGHIKNKDMARAG
jgi:hypothetical protein